MPNLVQWVLLAAIGLAVAAAVAWPLLRGRPETVIFDTSAEAEGRALRHRVALDALMDVEADRRAGSLDDASYQRELAEAEAHAAETLEGSGSSQDPVRTPPPAANSRRMIGWLGAAVAVLLVICFAVPGAAGLGERTVINRALADQLAHESARQAEIQRLLGLFSANRKDAGVISDLADAYLAGGSPEDLRRAAVALLVLLDLEPKDHSAYRRLINAYLVSADYADAQATTDAYAGIASLNEPDIPFYRGIIAFRQGDNAAAVREFDRFLALAHDDGRGSMVSSLRAEAAAALASASPSPGG